MFLPHSGCWDAPHGWGGEGLSEGIRGAGILPSISHIPSGCPPRSCWGHLACGFSHLAHDHPLCSTCLPHTTPHPVASFLCVPQRRANAHFCTQLASTGRKLTRLCGTRRKHTSLNIQHHPGESKQEGDCQHPAWLRRVERRQLIFKNSHLLYFIKGYHTILNLVPCAI